MRPGVATAIVIYPLVRRQSETVSLGYVSARIMESVFAAIGIIFRGTAYALRSQFSRDEEHGVRLVEYLFALSSVLTPFALATVIGAIATGRVPVGNAAGEATFGIPLSENTSFSIGVHDLPALHADLV